MKHSEEDENNASEFNPGYGKRLTFFKSVEELNEFNYSEMADHTPVERL